jgi:acetyl esterase/lipase
MTLEWGGGRDVSEEILDRAALEDARRTAYGEDVNQFGELRLPSGEGPWPLAICLHGGFWRAQYDLVHLGHLCAALAAAGIATWNVEYRRVGHEGGGWPETFLDVGRGTDYARELAHEYPLDLARVITVGHSAGGHLALWVAGRRRIPTGSEIASADPLPLYGAVALAGVVDLTRAHALGLSADATGDFLGGSPEEVPDRYDTASPRALLPLGVPHLLVHGTVDDSVPFELSEGYVEAARAAGDEATLLTLPGTGHFEVIDPLSREWPAILEAIRGLVES